MAVQHLASPEQAAQWLNARVRGTLHSDSRRVRPGDGFIAWPGQTHDGRRYVPQALSAGAEACLVEAEGAEAFAFDDERIAAQFGLKASTGAIAHRFYKEPSERLDTVAVTGTNGKTSCAWWMAQALSLLGHRCGVVGTLGVGEPGQVKANGLTTPDPVTLHTALRSFVDQGFSACAMEASSIGLVEHRLDGTQVDIALFTNFTQDHLDFHGSMAAYWAAKRSLFGWPGLRAAVVNIDDEYGAALADELRPSTLALWSCSALRAARLRVRNLHYVDGGLAFDIEEAGRSVAVRSRLVGDYNASNLMVVIGGLRAMGFSLQDAAAVVPQLTPVPGRLQRVGAGLPSQPAVLVDYAHTPDALSKVLQALRPLANARGGQLWCVFGCGGDRDGGKRPLMGGIAARLADQVVITSDNPRSESPLAIMAQIQAGIVGRGDVRAIEDRAAAINHVVQQAAAADVIVIAGKGHEDYQETAGVRRPFSDVQEASAALQRRGARS